MNKYINKNIFLLLLFLPLSCFVKYRAEVSLNISKMNDLSNVTDILYLESDESGVVMENAIFDLQSLFVKAGFNIADSKRKATVQILLTKKVKVVQVLTSTVVSKTKKYSRYRNGKQELGNDSIEEEVPILQNVNFITLDIVLVKNNKVILEASITGREDVVVKNMSEYITKIFDLIREGKELKKEVIYW